MILVHSPFVKTPDSKPLLGKSAPRLGPQGKQRNFEDMMAYMDKMVGRVVAKTKVLGIADRTLILFCGDNGTHRSIESRLHGKTIVGGKGSMKDSGTRVPLIAAWPGVIPAGKTCDDLVDFSDMLPTCLQAAGVAVPDGLDGRSFLPQLQGQPGRPRDWIYCFYCPRPERTPPQRFVRNQRWKLYGDGRLYHVAIDVKEKVDLSQQPLDKDGVAAKRMLQQALASMPAEGQSLWTKPQGGKAKQRNRSGSSPLPK